jgi:hypothetical protein
MSLFAPTSTAETSIEKHETQKNTETEYYKGEAFLAAKQGCGNAAEEYISQALKAARKENKVISPQEIEAILSGDSSYMSGEFSSEALQTAGSKPLKIHRVQEEFERQVQAIVDEIHAQIEMLSLLNKTFSEQEMVPVAA